MNKPNHILYQLNFDGYLVICHNYKSRYYNQYDDWVNENCTGKVSSDNYMIDRFFVFEKSDEAMAFKLRWL